MEKGTSLDIHGEKEFGILGDRRRPRRRASPIAARMEASARKREREKEKER